MLLQLTFYFYLKKTGKGQCHWHAINKNKSNTIIHDKKSLHIQRKPDMNSLADSENLYLVNNFKLALTMVLLKVHKDVKLTTLGGRLFQALETRSLKKFLCTLSRQWFTLQILKVAKVTTSRTTGRNKTHNLHTVLHPDKITETNQSSVFVGTLT